MEVANIQIFRQEVGIFTFPFLGNIIFPLTTTRENTPW